ncbi:MAG: hypothetical protein PQJ58_06205 [Spirochaetales bacterium]|nr:hypothetical protein [Spirochaetales bacterium]
MKHIIPEGTNLPRPYGISYVHHYQNQRFGLDSTVLGGLEIPSEALDRISIHNIAHIDSVRADVWLLPFLNVYSIFALGYGSAEVNISTPNMLDDLAGGYTWNSKGVGLGAIPTFGIGRFFTAVNLNYSWIWRSGSEMANAWIFNPRFGYSFPRFRFWFGAMYQYLDDEQSGTLGSENPVPYSVTLGRGKPWNGVFGFHFPFLNEKMEFVLEAGYGERVQVTTTIGYRWGGDK